VPQDAATTNAAETPALAGDSARTVAKNAENRRSRALFEIDPGWPFVVAGLGLIVAGVLIPAQRDLHELRGSLEVHRALLEHSDRRLDAYDRFLVAVDEAEPQLVRRLAASQLNKMPADERPYLMLPSMNATVSDWIDASEPLEVPAPAPYPDTLLARLATGPRRLWILASGVFLIFVGLVFGPSGMRSGVRRNPRAVPSRGEADRPESGLNEVDAVGTTAAVGMATIAAGSVVDVAVESLGGRLPEEVEPHASVSDVEAASAESSSAHENATFASAEVDADASSDEYLASIASTSESSPLMHDAAETSQSETGFETACDIEDVGLEEACDEACDDFRESGALALEPSGTANRSSSVDAADVQVSDVEDTHVEDTRVEDTDIRSDQVVTEVAVIGHESPFDGESALLESQDNVQSEVADEVADLDESGDLQAADNTDADESSEVDAAEVGEVDEVDEVDEADEADEVDEVDEADESDDADDSDDSDDSSVELRAETIAVPGEHELPTDAERPDAFDRALDTWSLFHGIDESRWIDTSDRRND
jgi:hypothetical protein